MDWEHEFFLRLFPGFPCSKVKRSLCAVRYFERTSETLWRACWICWHMPVGSLYIFREIWKVMFVYFFFWFLLPILELFLLPILELICKRLPSELLYSLIGFLGYSSMLLWSNIINNISLDHKFACLQE